MPKLTAELLRAYSEAALRNAVELHAEAILLLAHGHIARAYFLAISSIEEAGKALQAFDAQLRNLSDPAVCAKLMAGMVSHEMKINYAMSMWALHCDDPRAALKVAIDIVIDLQHGREPAMYSDLRSEPDRAQLPSEIFRPEAAGDCVRLAGDCLANAHRHVNEREPTKFASKDDRLFTMKSGKFREMLKTEDFWWFLVSRMEAGKEDFAEAVIQYENDHVKTGAPFRVE